MTEPSYEEITAAAKVLASFNGYDANAWSASDEVTRGAFRYDARLVLLAARSAADGVNGQSSDSR